MGRKIWEEISIVVGLNLLVTKFITEMFWNFLKQKVRSHYYSIRVKWIDCDHLHWNFHERGLRGSTRNSKFSIPMEIPREVVTLKLVFSIPSIPRQWNGWNGWSNVTSRVEIPLEGKNFEFFPFHPFHASGFNVTVPLH